jgi:hypothetical protein
MTENQEVPGRKRRSSEEIKRLVAEFEASGLRQSEFCRGRGLALSTLQRFNVKDGRYRGTAGKVGFDGIWSTTEGDAILAEVKTTDVYRLSLETTASYRRDLIKQGAIPEESSSILYVVGRSSTGDLEAQVRGSRHAWDIRLISVDALFRLVKIKEELEDQKNDRSYTPHSHATRVHES